MKKSPLHLLLATLCAICLLPVPVPALAHSGIGTATGFSAGFSHPGGGADHLLAMTAVGLWATQAGGRAVWSVPAAFVGMMIIGAALGISGIHVPHIEEGILLSVLILGLLIAGAFRLSLPVSVAIAGFFALFHGYAHGIEMPTATGTVSYIAGFALATVLLHAAGILAGAGLQKLHGEKITRLAGCAITLGGIYLTAS